MSDNNSMEYSTVTLSLDGDVECECAIIRIFPAGDNTYIALLPIEDEDEDGDEVFLYRFTEQEGMEPLLENIETDEEYDIVSQAFEEELDAMEMEAIYDSEEED